ncbi:MAG: HAD-IA family hydrolase [Burkholderiales bacterium]|nr:HAD-IA family hydrolase [Burkholderiales bacterium]
MKTDFFLFDLDGTLADSAPALAAAANHLREVRNLPKMPFEKLRPAASHGARGLLGVAFGITKEDPSYAEMEKEFLDYYSEHLTENLTLFPGVRQLLDELDAHQVKWGIVTNKFKKFTDPAVDYLNIHPGVIVCGDTVGIRKPSPEPILYAVKKLNSKPELGVYVGDDIRDIQAGNAAGCFTVAAGWGYLGSEKPITQWGADAILEKPLELLTVKPLT